MTEHDIQNAIRLKLSELGYYTERINVGEGYLVHKELFQQLKIKCKNDKKLFEQLEKVKYFHTGASKGRSDLTAVKDGRVYFIEVKTPTGRVSEEQKHFIAVMRDRYGCAAGIVRSVRDAEELVTHGYDD